MRSCACVVMKAGVPCTSRVAGLSGFSRGKSGNGYTEALLRAPLRVLDTLVAIYYRVARVLVLPSCLFLSDAPGSIWEDIFVLRFRLASGGVCHGALVSVLLFRSFSRLLRAFSVSCSFLLCFTSGRTRTVFVFFCFVLVLVSPPPFLAPPRLRPSTSALHRNPPRELSLSSSLPS